MTTATTALDQEIQDYAKANPGSAKLNERAKQSMPGGDTRNSIWWKPFPIYIARGQGSTMTDVDGNERVEEFDGEPRFTVQINGFSDCILNGTAPEFPPIDGLRNTAAVLALYGSADSGKITAVEQV